MSSWNNANTGRVSEWNEGVFKSIRLHEVQEAINLLRMNPLGTTDGKFNYSLMFLNITNLYLEGYSKFSPSERKEVDSYKLVLQEIINDNPPTTKVLKEEIGGTSSTILIDQHKMKLLLHLLEEYERKIKDLNDKHGLTTTNKQSGGLF